MKAARRDRGRAGGGVTGKAQEGGVMGYPLTVDHVVLVVQDLGVMRDFHAQLLGLQILSDDGRVAQLGAGGRLLVELRHDPTAHRPGRNEARLYHTAFLLPDRAALGGWLTHAIAAGIRLQGAADHGVSEALYLADPEGNGIEVYADRPAESWPREGDRIPMVTKALDLDALMADAAPWRGMPDSGRIGHLHLRSTDHEAAAARFRQWGMVETMRAPGAVWLGSGGYHHQIAVNSWHVRAPHRSPPVTGLAGYALRASAASGLAPGLRHDADGTQVTILADEPKANPT